MEKDELVEMLLRAQVWHLSTFPERSLPANLTFDQITLGGQVPCSPSRRSGCGSNMVEPTAIPAPSHSFLGYDVHRSVASNIVARRGTNAGLGVSMPAPASAPAPASSNTNNWATNNAAPAAASPSVANSTTQNWGGNNDWNNNNTNAAPVPASAPAPAAQQNPTDSWGLAPGPAQAQGPPQPQARPAVSPIQINPNVQTYKPGGPPPSSANNGPVPSSGRWVAQPHTVQSSNASDNGMAGWNAQVSAGGGGGGVGGGWGAPLGAAPLPPTNVEW